MMNVATSTNRDLTVALRYAESAPLPTPVEAIRDELALRYPNTEGRTWADFDLAHRAEVVRVSMACEPIDGLSAHETAEVLVQHRMRG